jgi:hypothetical protein
MIHHRWDSQPAGVPAGQYRRGGPPPGHPPGHPRFLWSVGRLGGRPGDLSLIGQPAGQAAVQDADLPVAQGPQRLVVGGAAGPVGVVATPRTRPAGNGLAPPAHSLALTAQHVSLERNQILQTCWRAD